MKLEFTGLNTNKFHDEMIASGIDPATIVVTSSEDKTWVEVSDEALVENINSLALIHDPTPKPQPKSELETLREQFFEQNQTISDLMDILFATVPELQEL